MIRRAARVVRRLAAEKYPVRFLASRLLWRTGLCRLLAIDLGYARLRFAPTAMSATLWVDPAARGRDVAVFREILGQGDVVVDIGANVGSLSLLASHLVGASGRVYALEPNPRTFAYLLANLQLNCAANVVPVCAAAGKVDGIARLAAGRSDDQDRLAGSGQPVPLVRLDTILSGEARPVKLLKVDVEGAELAVLEGAADLLRRTEWLYVECGDELSARYGYEARDLIQHLIAHGFEVMHRSTKGELVPLDFSNGLATTDLVARSRLVT